MKGERLQGGQLFTGDALDILPQLKGQKAQAIIADPPYFNVLENQDWDTAWPTEEAYLEWTEKWVKACKPLLADNGLMFIFGQLGKREHVWLHLCSRLSRIMQFHDMIIWDRVVGYNDRKDSFTPQYEMALVLRHKEAESVFFDKDAVRIPYDNETIQQYMRDKRYKDLDARAEHLNKGKYATNILKIPSLKGSSKEKIGHPSQKPIALIKQLIACSTREGDMVLDPFMGSGTTAEAAVYLGRQWIGIESDNRYTAMTKQRLLAFANESDLPLLAG